MGEVEMKEIKFDYCANRLQKSAATRQNYYKKNVDEVTAHLHFFFDF